MSARTRLDTFFARLEKDPYYGMRNGFNKGEANYENYIRQRTRLLRELTVLKAQVDTVIDQISGVMKELMEDPLYFEIAEKLLADLHGTLSILEDAINRNEEDIQIIDFTLDHGNDGKEMIF